jgi:hypothetical protein
MVYGVVFLLCSVFFFGYQLIFFAVDWPGSLLVQLLRCKGVI